MEEENTDPDSLQRIGSYQNPSLAEEHGLVVIAMQMPCWILNPSPAHPDYQLAVHPSDASRAQAEIAAYDLDALEDAASPGRLLPSYSTGRWLAFCSTMLLLLCFKLQQTQPEFENQLISDNHAIIEQGQTYTAATALLLHADTFHLLGNLIFGVGFALLVAASIGPISGWFLIILSGFVGNLINAHAYYPTLHRSLGASTSVFGALGILTGFGIIAAFLSPKSAPWARAILPIAGGIALLSWFGLGGPDVDFMAHIYGFSVGIPLGFVAGWIRIFQGSQAESKNIA